MQAAKSGMTEVCKLYIEHGAEVDVCTVVSGCNFWRVGSWHGGERGVSRRKKAESSAVVMISFMIKQLLIWEGYSNRLQSNFQPLPLLFSDQLFSVTSSNGHAWKNFNQMLYMFMLKSTGGISNR